MIIVYVQKVCRTKENLPRYRSFLTNLTIDRTTESIQSLIRLFHIPICVNLQLQPLKPKYLGTSLSMPNQMKLKKQRPQLVPNNPTLKCLREAPFFFLQRFFFNFHHRYLGNASVVK